MGATVGRVKDLSAAIEVVFDAFGGRALPESPGLWDPLSLLSLPQASSLCLRLQQLSSLILLRSSRLSLLRRLLWPLLTLNTPAL